MIGARIVRDTRPASIGEAIRFMTSAPVPFESMTGARPATFIPTVIRIGRTTATRDDLFIGAGVSSGLAASS